MSRSLSGALLSLLMFAAALPSLAQDETNAQPSGSAPAVDTEIPVELEVIEDLPAEFSLEQIKLLAAPLTVEQLEAEAVNWQTQLQDGMSHIATLKVAALEAEGEELSALREEILELSERRNKDVEKFLALIDAFEKKGGDPALVKSYRDYVKAALAAEWAATDLDTLLTATWQWLASWKGGLGILAKVLMILGSLFLLAMVARFVSALANRALKRAPQLSQLLRQFLSKLVFWLAFIVGFLVVLGMFGVNITPLFAVLGGASFIIAFAMQETLGNLASGLMIMINKPFDEGDLVDTNGILGTVEAVSIVSTTVRTFDNQVIILPNSSVWGSVITNVTVSPTRRVDLVFGIGYGDDIDKATAILERLVGEHELILDDPVPMIRVHELADSSVNFIVRPWTRTENYWTVYWDLTKAVKQAFDAEGVSIPFPQRDVHLFQDSG